MNTQYSINLILFLSILNFVTAADVSKLSQFKPISGTKCKEYRNSWTNKSCQKAQSITLGAKPTVPNEFTHVALLGYTQKNSDKLHWGCTGSIISPNFVLAAAQCLYPTSSYTLRFIKIGANSRESKEPNSKICKIKELIQHPDYNKQTFNNDIGLIKLNSSIVFNQFISPICLSLHNVAPKNVTAVIFGKLDSDTTKTEKMLKVGLERFGYTKCQRELGENPRINETTMLCYGHNRNDTNLYQPSLVGPIHMPINRNNTCTLIQVGLISFGYHKHGAIGKPDVFVNIYPYLKWIENIVWKNKS